MNKTIPVMLIMFVCGWLMWLALIPLIGSTSWAHLSNLQMWEFVGVVSVLLGIVILPYVQVKTSSGPIIGCLTSLVVWGIIVGMIVALLISFGF